MKGTFFKGVLLGAVCSTLVLVASSALAGSGVGAIFNLGVFNSVSGATTDLAGSHSGPTLRVDNAGTGNAIVGRLTNATPAVHTAGILGNNLATNGFGFGLWGSHQSGGVGVLGSTVSGIGVRGTHQATFGTLAGVEGFTNSPLGPGGRFENETAGVGTEGVGLQALGRDHDAVDLDIGGDDFDAGLEAAGPNGVEGNSHTPGGVGVTGDGPGAGVVGTATDTGGSGGAFFGGTSGTGVVATGGFKGVFATGLEFGVDALVTDPAGIAGVRSIAGANAQDAIQGYSSSIGGDAVQAVTSGPLAAGLMAVTTGGGTGVVTDTAGGVGISATNNSDTKPTVSASNAATGGVAGQFTGKFGLNVTADHSFGIGLTLLLTGDTDGNGMVNDDGQDAILASSDDINSDGVVSAIAAAGSTELSHEAIETVGFLDVNGDARVTGNLDVVGTCCGPLIDHPLDPANSYLRHGAVSAPELKNVYDGTVRTDADGFATVTMPAYFPALNRDFRYQLTVLGRSFAQAIVWDKLATKGGRKFTIRTSEGGVEVSWQVTGIRNDAYAIAHPLVVEQRKPAAVRGQFLHPELFGRPQATPLGLDLASPLSKPVAAARAKAAAELQALVAKKAAEARRQARQPAKAPVPLRQDGR